MIRVYVISLLFSIFMYLISDSGTQKNRTVYLIVIYFIVLNLGFLGKYLIKKIQYERIGSIFLFVSMMLCSEGIIILEYASDIYVGMNSLFMNTLFIFFMATLILFYTLFMKRNGKNYFSDRVLAYVYFIPVFLVFILLIVMSEINDDSTKLSLALGIFFILISFMQYRRINLYIEKRSTERYGDTINYLKNKKGMK